jgi:hypothetical protein
MSIPIRLKAAFSGNLEKIVDEQLKHAAGSVTAGVTRATKEFEHDLESAVEGARLGKLAKAWNSKIYPKGRDSLGAAGIVYVKGGDRSQGAMIAFSEGASISPKGGGRYLAIPTGYNKTGGRRNGKGGVKVTPAEMLTSKLAFVLPSKNGTKLWCLKVLEASARGRNDKVVKRAIAGGVISIGSGRRGRVEAALKRGFVPMFILLPKVSLAKRFSIDGLARRAQNNVVVYIADDFNRRSDGHA